MNSKNILDSIKLTGPEKQAIQNCNARLDALTKLAETYRLPVDHIMNGLPSPLWSEICDTAEQFTESPSAEIYERHLLVLAKIDLLILHKSGLQDLGRRAVDAARAPLDGIKAAILTRALAAVESKLAERRKAATEAGLETELEAAAARCRADLETERAAVGLAHNWLFDHEFLA